MLGLAPAGAEKTLWISLINQVRLSFPTGDEQVLQNIVSGMSQLNTPLEFQDQVLDERKVRRDAREQKREVASASTRKPEQLAGASRLVPFLFELKLLLHRIPVTSTRTLLLVHPGTQARWVLALRLPG